MCNTTYAIKSRLINATPYESPTWQQNPCYGANACMCVFKWCQFDQNTIAGPAHVSVDPVVSQIIIYNFRMFYGVSRYYRLNLSHQLFLRLICGYEI